MPQFSDNPDLNAALNTVYRKAIEDVFKHLPSFIMHTFFHTARMAEVKRKFYAENPDIEENKGILARVLAGIEESEPGLPVEEMLDRAAAATRNVVKTKEKIYGTEIRITPGKQPQGKPESGGAGFEQRPPKPGGVNHPGGPAYTGVGQEGGTVGI